MTKDSASNFRTDRKGDELTEAELDYVSGGKKHSDGPVKQYMEVKLEEALISGV
jgi:hypothetical protein